MFKSGKKKNFKEKLKYEKCNPKWIASLKIVSLNSMLLVLPIFSKYSTFTRILQKKFYQPDKKRILSFFFHYQPFTTHKIKLIKKTMNLQCIWSNNTGLYCIQFLAVLASLLKSYKQSFSLSHKNILIK